MPPVRDQAPPLAIKEVPPPSAPKPVNEHPNGSSVSSSSHRNGLVRACLPKFREIAPDEMPTLGAIIRRSPAGQILQLPNKRPTSTKYLRDKNAIGRALFLLNYENVRANRARETREATELKVRISDLVKEHEGDASLIPAIAVAVRQLHTLLGDFSPLESDLSTLIKFSAGDSDSQYFRVSVAGYDVRQIPVEALRQAQTVCQVNLNNHLLSCKCEIQDSSVTMTVSTVASLEALEEEDE